MSELSCQSPASSDEIVDEDPSARSRRDLLAVIDSNPDGVLILGGDTVRYANRAMADFLGLRSTTLLPGFRITNWLAPGEWIRWQQQGHASTLREFRFLDSRGEQTVLELTAPRCILFDSEECDLVIARDITERLRLRREAEEAADRERQRISYELHEGIGQQIVGLSWLAKTVAESIESGREVDASRARDLASGLHETLMSMRKMARKLDSASAVNHGLREALLHLARISSELSGGRCEFQCYLAPRVDVRDPDTAVHLYRIAQEAANNAIEHSGASQVVIGLDRNANRIRLWIRDDGVRGHPSPHGTVVGIGLRIMHHRAAALGGVLAISPGEPHGTVVECTVPLDRAPSKTAPLLPLT